MTTTPMPMDHPAPTYEEVGYMDRLGDKLVIHFHGSPEKYYAQCEDMKALAAGGLMKDMIRLRRRDESQTVLFGERDDLPGGSAVLSYSKKSIRLNLPGDARMLMINTARVDNVINGRSPSCPVSVFKSGEV